MPAYIKYISYKSSRCQLQIDPDRKTIRIMSVYSGHRRRGNGTQLMNLVCELADEMEMRLVLRARPYGEDQMSKDDLKSFYMRFGFVITKGDHMVRPYRGGIDV